MKFRVHIEQDEDGKFIASCPTLPGCLSDGDTREDALVNMKDAIEGYLTSVTKSRDPIPTSAHEEIIDIDMRRVDAA